VKSYTRYLVVKVTIGVDASKTDQNPDDHIAEIAETVAAELDCNVSFSGTVEAGNDANNAIEVPVKITETEVLALLDTDPT
jgi:hypothetical protein